mgnify:CR=1 FL=1
MQWLKEVSNDSYDFTVVALHDDVEHSDMYDWHS